MKERKYKFGFVGMNDMSIRTIDECFYQIRNGANIKQGTVEGGYPITRIETTANDRFNRDRMGYAGITDIEKYESYILQDGDLLMSHINSVQYLGRTVLYEKQGNEKIIHGMNLLGLKARRDIIIPAYARYCFYSYSFRQQIGRITKKSVNQASFAVVDLKKIKIKVPDLSEQSRVVDILNRLNQVIEDRQQELQKLDDLTKARFVEMFENKTEYDQFRLEEIADIVSGITKGRKTKCGELREVPYMAVSNVKDGYIDWTTVKTILATEDEIIQYKLLPDDVLMTEGGDPDKLGRGAIISLPPKDCIHQNHIFRVRLDETRILPRYFSAYLQSPQAKTYLLRAAKQTTGIASINMRQLRGLPTIVPSIEQQLKYVSFSEQVDKSKVEVQKALDETQKLFDSLMQQYFG